MRNPRSHSLFFKNFAWTIWLPFECQTLKTNQKGGWPLESEGSIGPSSIPHSNISWFSLLLLFWLLLLLLGFSFRILFCFRILVFVLEPHPGVLKGHCSSALRIHFLKVQRYGMSGIELGSAIFKAIVLPCIMALAPRIH